MLLFGAKEARGYESYPTSDISHNYIYVFLMSKFRRNKIKFLRQIHLFTATFRAQLHLFSNKQFFCKSTKKHKFINVKTPWRENNKMQLMIMDIIQSYYTLSSKNNGTELIVLFNIDLSRLINKLSLISNKNLLVPWARMVKSSNEGSWLQKRRWSRINSADGLTFLKVNGEMPMCSPDLTFKYLSVSP